MKRNTILALLSLVGLFAGSAHAALVWEKSEVELNPSLSDKTAVAHFKFKNTGDQPVKITSVHSSCGCTTAALAKDEVAPNESGEIVATFTIGDRSGVQSKTITVMTDDQPGQAKILRLKATIPQLITVAPIFIHWSEKDLLEPKTITVEVGDFPVTKLTVTPTDKSIETEVKPGANKKQFLIVVRPTESGRPINSSLKIEPDYPKDAPKLFYATVRVDSRAVATPPPQ